MSLFFITYDNNLIGCYTPIEAEDYATARKIAYEGTDKGKFAFMYTGQDELDKQIAAGYLNGGAVELHPMCLKFESHKDKFLVLYPAGMFPDGAQARFVNGGKTIALNRLLDAMERHWVANAIH